MFTEISFSKIILTQPLRKHEQNAINEMAEDIDKFGLEYKIVVAEKDNGKYLLLDGRLRLQAMKQLGYTKCYCRVIDFEIIDCELIKMPWILDYII